MQNRGIILSGLLLTAALGGLPQNAAIASLQTVWIYKNAGAVQCRTDGIPLDVMEKTLTAEGIEVITSCRTYDGAAYPAVCGGGTGLINVYEIAAANLQKALGLGFGERSRMHGYTGLPCQPNQTLSPTGDSRVPRGRSLGRQPAD